jgi:hypothetical protein
MFPEGLSCGGRGLIGCRRPCRQPGCSSDARRGFAGPVVTHCGAWVGVTGGDLDVPQVYASVEHGRDEGVPEHVRVRPGNPDSRSFGEPAQPAVAAWRSIRAPRLLSRIRPLVRVAMARSMARATAGGNGIRTT